MTLVGIITLLPYKLCYVTESERQYHIRTDDNRLPVPVVRNAVCPLTPDSQPQYFQSLTRVP